MHPWRSCRKSVPIYRLSSVEIENADTDQKIRQIVTLVVVAVHLASAVHRQRVVVIAGIAHQADPAVVSGWNVFHASRSGRAVLQTKRRVMGMKKTQVVPGRSSS